MDRQQYEKIKTMEMKMRKYQFRYIRRQIDEANLYKGDPRLLMAIVEKEGCTQAELAKKLCIKPATLTVMIKRIETAGLIERRMDERDLRLLRVYPTEEGRRIAAKTQEVLRDAVYMMFEGIEESDLAVYERVVEAITENLKNDLEEDKKNKKQKKGKDTLQIKDTNQ